MRRLFRPAEALMNRLKYPLKFLAMGLLMVLALAAMLWGIARQQQATIERAEQEQHAAELARPLSELVRLAQQQRGRHHRRREQGEEDSISAANDEGDYRAAAE